MTKKILIYIAGIITGAVLMILFAVLFADKSSVDNGMTLFGREGACVGNNSFKVMQVLDSGDALAVEMKSGIAIGITVLFMTDGKTSYYDNQIIDIPSGMCAKQLGTFKYESKDGMSRTVPIVGIRNL